MSTTSDDLARLTPDPAGSPVFVDASGRRARRIERLAALIVLLCMGYGLTLLIAAMTGVPIQGAVVPYPDLGSGSHATAPAPAPIPPPDIVSGTLLPGRPTPTPSASSTPGASSSSSHPSTGTTPTAHPTHSTRPTVGPTAKPTPSHGSSSTAPGATHRPTAHPTVAHSHGPVVHP